MKPTVLMAVWGRRKLVEINLRLLLSEDCNVVCITSLQDDFDFLRGLKFKNLQVVTAPNHPLGRKWQIGVDFCQNFDADPLIILGSDDFLSRGFIQKACELSQKFDFIYFDKWFIHEVKTKKSYSLDYQMVKYLKPPLGGGRIYSKTHLEKCNYQLFDRSMDSRLDDFGWYERPGNCKELMNPQGMHILSVKGEWEMKNPIDKFLNHDKISWNREYQIAALMRFDIEQTFNNV